MSRRRTAVATGAVGTGLVVGGALAANRGIALARSLHPRDLQHARNVLHRTPAYAVLKAPAGAKRVRARALYTAGSAGMLIGGPAMISSYDQLRHRSVAKHDRRHHGGLLNTGVRGALQVTSDRVQSARAPAPWQARVLPLMVGGAGVAAGSQGGHKLIDQVIRRGGRIGPRTRAVSTALTSTLGAGASIPVTNRFLRRAAPGYRLTPTGVKPQKTAFAKYGSVGAPDPRCMVCGTRTWQGLCARCLEIPIPYGVSKAAPARTMHLIIGRDGLPACSAHKRWASSALSGSRTPRMVTCRNCQGTHHYRSRIGQVAKGDPGANMSTGQRRAAIYAAGAVPVIGTAAAASTAARLAPPSARKRTAAVVYGGTAASNVAGAAAGGYAVHRLVQRSPRTGVKILDAQNKLGQVRNKAIGRVSPAMAARSAARAGRPSMVARSVARMPAPVREFHGRLSPAVLAGAYAGKTAFGLVGGQASISATERHNAKVRAGIMKLDVNGMTIPERRADLKRRRRVARLTTLGAAFGTAGVGLGSARMLVRNPKVKERIGAAALNTALAGGGVGAIGGFQRAHLEHRQIEAAQRKIDMSKAFPGFHTISPGTGRARGLRRSGFRRTGIGLVRTRWAMA